MALAPGAEADTALAIVRRFCPSDYLECPELFRDVWPLLVGHSQEVRETVLFDLPQSLLAGLPATAVFGETLLTLGPLVALEEPVRERLRYLLRDGETNVLFRLECGSALLRALIQMWPSQAESSDLGGELHLSSAKATQLALYLASLDVGQAVVTLGHTGYPLYVLARRCALADLADR